MLSEIVIGLSLIASAVFSLASEVYVAKKVSSLNAGLNRRATEPRLR